MTNHYSCHASAFVVCSSRRHTECRTGRKEQTRFEGRKVETNFDGEDSKITNTTEGLRVRTQVKVGGPIVQHSEAKGLRVRTQVKAGGWSLNHSQAKGLKVRTQVKAGGRQLQHSEAKGLRLPVPPGITTGPYAVSI